MALVKHCWLIAALVPSVIAPHPAYAQGAAKAPSPPSAIAPKDAARRLFDEGLELEKKGEFTAALAKYTEAEGLVVTAGLLFHKGYCLEMNGKSAEALDAYDAADALAVEGGKLEVRAAIGPRRERLDKLVPRLAIRVAEPDASADVRLDGQRVKPDGSPVRINAGKHVVTASLPDRELFVRTFTLSADGATTTIDVSLVQHIPEPALVAEPPREPTKKVSYTTPIVTSAITVALVAGGVTSFLLAGKAQSDAEEACARRPFACDDTDRTKIRTLDAVALGSFIGAAAAGAASVVLFATAAPKKDRADAPRATVVATGTALGVRGVF